jgi:hypothetical protein
VPHRDLPPAARASAANTPLAPQILLLSRLTAVALLAVYSTEQYSAV